MVYLNINSKLQLRIDGHFVILYSERIVGRSLYADRLFCRNSIKCETSSLKHDCPLSEVLLPITTMDLIGNWKFKYCHTNDLSPYMVVT